MKHLVQDKKNAEIIKKYFISEKVSPPPRETRECDEEIHKT